ncbi:AI-2E family transporter [bacterium]|nr:AI-2E family transporter [bacterium]
MYGACIIIQDISKSPFLIGIAVFTLLAAFVYTAHEILSPILIGILLLYVLSSIHDNAFARRLTGAVWILLLIWMFIRAQVIFFPFVAAFTLAYLLDPLVDFMTRHRISRPFASLLILLVVIIALISVGVLLVPNLVHELQNFSVRLPEVVESIQAKILKSLPRMLHMLRIEESDFRDNWTNTVPKGLQKVFDNLLNGILSITAFMGRLLNLIIIPVITFYILKDFDKIRTWFLSMFPKRRRPRVSYYVWRVNRIIGRYLRAQVMVCMVVGFLTGLLLAMFGIQFAVLLGVITGLLNIIPYIGLYVSLILSCSVAFLDPNPLTALIKVIGVFVVVQGLEATVIQPKIIGDRVGLHPVTVMFSVLFFSRFFGFWGLLIGVPTAAVVMFYLDEWKRKRALLELIEEGAFKSQQIQK